MHPPALACGPTILSRIMPDGPLLAFLDSPSHLVGSRLELWGQPPHFQPDALSIQLFAAPLCHPPPAQDMRLCALSLTVTGEVTASSGGCWGQLAGACSGDPLGSNPSVFPPPAQASPTSEFTAHLPQQTGPGARSLAAWFHNYEKLEPAQVLVKGMLQGSKAG